MSDDWEPEDLDLESAMLTMAPGTFQELHGVVVFCSGAGVRGMMNADDWNALQAKLKGSSAKKE